VRFSLGVITLSSQRIRPVLQGSNLSLRHLGGNARVLRKSQRILHLSLTLALSSQLARATSRSKELGRRAALCSQRLVVLTLSLSLKRRHLATCFLQCSFQLGPRGGGRRKLRVQEVSLVAVTLRSFGNRAQLRLQRRRRGRSCVSGVFLALGARLSCGKVAGTSQHLRKQRQQLVWKVVLRSRTCARSCSKCAAISRFSLAASARRSSRRALRRAKCACSKLDEGNGMLLLAAVCAGMGPTPG